MSEPPVFALHEGSLPLLISIPHAGRRLPDGMAATLTAAARPLPDTDWFVDDLYAFCRAMGAALLVANYSRYVVDLNRSPEDVALYPGRFSTGLCPLTTFAGNPVYIAGREPGETERAARIECYWQPYHDAIARQLDALRQRHGYALLWDAHSIASRVPNLFEGELPVLNIGSNVGSSCPAAIEEAVVSVAAGSSYSAVLNGRFRGGYITRHYGKPAASCYALQLELAQRSYMEEGGLRYDPERASQLMETLCSMLQAFVDAARTQGEKL